LEQLVNIHAVLPHRHSAPRLAPEDGSDPCERQAAAQAHATMAATRKSFLRVHDIGSLPSLLSVRRK
jgi:hypothetical protein